MLIEYTQEQKQLTAKLAIIEAELNSTGNDEQNVQKLKAVLNDFLNVETLTANMLNQLIERIEIGHTVRGTDAGNRKSPLSTVSSERRTKFETGIKVRITTVQSRK